MGYSHGTGLLKLGLLNRECASMEELASNPNSIMGFFCNSQICNAGYNQAKGVFIGTKETSYIDVCPYCGAENILMLKISRHQIPTLEEQTNKKLRKDAALKVANEKYRAAQEEKERIKKQKKGASHEQYKQ